MKYSKICKQIVERLVEVTGWNEDRCILWLTTPNAFFVGMTPRHLINRGKHRKVIAFIEEVAKSHNN